MFTAKLGDAGEGVGRNVEFGGWGEQASRQAETEEAFDVSHDVIVSVGAHRLAGEPAALKPGQRLFTFVAAT